MGHIENDNMNINARIPLPVNRYAVISVPDRMTHREAEILKKLIDLYVCEAETDIDDDILEQIEEGQRDDAEIRDLEDYYVRYGI